MPGQSDLLSQLAALQGGNQTDPAAMLAEHADPRVRLLAQMWAQNREEDEPEAESAAPAKAETGTSEQTRRLARLRRKLKILSQETVWLQDLNEALAAALGACPLCWGEDEDCDECDGDGVSGWDEPDAELFAEFVAPAIQRVREAENRRARASTATPRRANPKPEHNQPNASSPQ